MVEWEKREKQRLGYYELFVLFSFHKSGFHCANNIHIQHDTHTNRTYYMKWKRNRVSGEAGNNVVFLPYQLKFIFSHFWVSAREKEQNVFLEVLGSAEGSIGINKIFSVDFTFRHAHWTDLNSPNQSTPNNSDDGKPIILSRSKNELNSIKTIFSREISNR